MRMPRRFFFAAFASLALQAWTAAEEPAQQLKVGLASRDITPEGPIRLNGYAARTHESEKVDQALHSSAAVFEDAAGERIVFISVDNCEVSREFMEPALKAIEEKHKLASGAVITVTTHTHSAPCLDGVLPAMSVFEGQEKERIAAYGQKLRGTLVDVVSDAIADLKPAKLERGSARAFIAMNRRIYAAQQVQFGENPEAPVDREVPVLKISAPAGDLRAIIFGYACHATSISGAEFYWVSGDYPGYAREHLEAAFPGTKALFLTGCGADSNPAPRGRLAHAKQHGLELAGAVTGALRRPMEPVRGPIRRAYARLELPLAPNPTREKLVADAEDKDQYLRNRARLWLSMLDAGKPLPKSVSFPMEVVRFGDDLTLFCLAGEVVVDYSLRLKREFAADRPWVVGYAFETPCYIPSLRILREGGYEADSSLIYYGIYGPLLGTTEELIIGKFRELVDAVRSR